MNYRITSRGINQLVIDRTLWGMLLELAERYGWKPGNLPPPRLDQCGCCRSKELSFEEDWNPEKYYSEYMFGPTVTDRDALGLQDALRRGRRLLLAERRRQLRSSWNQKLGPTNDPPMWLINQFISFLDDGEFYIDEDY